MNEITTEQKPIKMWLDDLEPQALEQAKHLANLPFLFSHVAIMPDSHVCWGRKVVKFAGLKILSLSAFAGSNPAPSIGDYYE